MSELVVESTPGEDEHYYLSKLQQTLNEMVEMTMKTGGSQEIISKL